METALFRLSRIHGGDFLPFIDAYGTGTSDALYLAALDYDNNGTIDFGGDFLPFNDDYGLSL